MLLALALTAALSSPSNLSLPAPETGAVVVVDDKAKGEGKEPGWMEKFFPFSLSADAVQPVKDSYLLTQFFGYCLPPCLGNLWGPLVLLPDDGRKPSMDGDIVIAWLVPTAVGVGWWVLWGGIGWAAAVATFFVGGLGGIIGCIGCAAVIAPFLATNATLNAWNRAYKGEGGAKKPAGKKPEGDAPPPSYAY